VTTIDLDAIRQREQAATEGPWIHTGRNHISTPDIHVDEANWGGEGLNGYRLVCDGDEGAWRAADAEFIAHAREDIPALLAEIDRLRSQVAEITSLTRDTDGDDLDPDSEIPVGEIHRALHDAAATR
jgi:hypothetical protein